MESFPTTRYDAIVVGGGQSGLAAGYYLKRAGRSFLIVDGDIRTGDRWRRRWDSLRLFSPAQFDSLPGLPFPMPHGAFPTKDQTADYLEAYARSFELPILHGTRVSRVGGASPEMVIECDAGRFESRNVIVATGAYSVPRIPAFAKDLSPAIHQIHSSEYRRPSDVPGPAVVVVGFGTSGVEIATELARAGRKVVLAGRATVQFFSKFAPRLFAAQHPVGRHLGRAYWGLMKRLLTVDTPFGQQARSQAQRRGQPLFGLNERDAVRAGVETAPRVTAVKNGNPCLANGRVVETAAVVWCTGFLPTYSFLDFPALSYDEKGWPATDHGSAPRVPGLYFVGLPFQVGLTSTLLGGVGRDAEIVVRRIVAADSAGQHGAAHESCRVDPDGGAITRRLIARGRT